MPNLEHDPKNPTDLLDRPIAAGDIVAWGTTYGRSAALCVAVIERIRFYQESCAATNWKNKDCPQAVADDYQLVLRPLKSTGSVTLLKPNGEPYYEHRDGPRYAGDGVRAKLKTILHVKNVVKLDGVDSTDVFPGDSW